VSTEESVQTAQIDEKEETKEEEDKEQEN